MFHIEKINEEEKQDEYLTIVEYLTKSKDFTKIEIMTLMQGFNKVDISLI